MSRWSPTEAAEYKAACAAATLRLLAGDPKARLGLHRALGIARAQGYGETAIMGIKFEMNVDADQVAPLQGEQSRGRQQSMGEHAQPFSAGEQAQHERTRKPRKRSDARKAKEREKLDEKWRARRAAEQRVEAPQPHLENEPRIPEPTSVNAFVDAAFDAKEEATLHQLREAVRAEQIRVANSARVDVSTVLGECLAVQAEADAEGNRGRPVSRENILRRKLARLAAFETELLTAAAPDGHMVTEWGPQVQGQMHPGPEGASKRSP